MLISNDYARLLQFSIIDERKNNDDTIIANKNIDTISVFTINGPSLIHTPLVAGNMPIKLWLLGDGQQLHVSCIMMGACKGCINNILYHT